MAERGLSQKDTEFSQIVIVGAGIAGLATALAFHRLGLKTLVLEQSDKLRPGGTSIGLWKNAWHALDALDVSEELRKNYEIISCVDFFSTTGKLIHRASFDNDTSHGLRSVHRKALLEALAKPLPKETIRFNSKVAKISKVKAGSEVQIDLHDGTTITSKVLIGCDGVHSVVAQWMGLKEPGFVGQYAIRGLAKYPAGHKYGSISRQYLGRGTRAGIASVSSDQIYWFFVVNSPKQQDWITDPERVKEEARIRTKIFPSDSQEIMYDLIDNSPPETVSRTMLKDRWTLPFFTPRLAADGVTLAGDALHPMTPNLGQGGCLALEDAVVLAREVYTVLETQEESSQGLSHALETYTKQRWKRFWPLIIQARIMGAFMTSNSAIISYLRDNFVLPYLLPTAGFPNHTHFHCGALPTQK